MTNQNNHIDWIDGAKGVAILSVILLHSLPCLREMGWMWHIGQAVPVFLFITAYLVSIRMESIKAYFTFDRFGRMLKKVFVPFVLVLILQVGCLVLADKDLSIKAIIRDGGIGPGSYYIWLYLQSWILIPFIVWLVRKVPVWASCLIMLTISVVAEYAFVPIEHIKVVGDVYRLMPVRYLMVLYLGCVWPMLKDKQKYVFYGLACISALMMLKDAYLADNMWFANSFMGGVKSYLRIGVGIIGIRLHMYLYRWHYWNGYDIRKFGNMQVNIVGIYSCYK